MIKKLFNNFVAIFIFCFFAMIGSVLAPIAVSAATNTLAQSKTNSQLEKVAPGELLPVSVKLSNFGGGVKVDVYIKYSITNNQGGEIYSTSDTVAVETTANFTKNLQVPSDIAAGTYIAKTSIIYQGQLTSASSQFTFIVENKILGVFQSDFFLYAGIAVAAGAVLIILTRLFIRRVRLTRFTPLDYRNVPADDRVFYEILSDSIMQMRNHVGDSAIIIAANIKGLNIDEKTGRVLGFTDNPSKVIANLVSEYEKQLGKKVSFSLLRDKIE